jgi:hypothetical protein
MGTNITFTINCNYRTPTTLYTPQSWFVAGIQVEIPCVEVVNKQTKSNRNNNNKTSSYSPYMLVSFTRNTPPIKCVKLFSWERVKTPSLKSPFALQSKDKTLLTPNFS